MYTQLNLDATHRLHFHNQVLHEAGGHCYLHPPHPPFNGGQEWQAGTWVSGPGGQTFEALQNLAAGSNLSNAQQWAPRGQVCYADKQSLIRFSGPITQLAVSPPSATVEVKIFAHPANEQPLDQPLMNRVFSHHAPVAQQDISFEKMPVGLYRVVVNGISQVIYADAGRQWHNHAGLLAVGQYTHLPAQAQWLDAAGNLLSPKYTIRLAPRSVIWQYRARTEAVRKIEDETGTILFDQTAPRQFTSRLPVRLHQKAYPHMVLEYNNTSPPDPLKAILIKKLPAPDYSRLGQIRQNNTDYLLATASLPY